MTASAFACLNASGHPKKAYPSPEAAKRDLMRSPRWRLRKSWPSAFHCSACHRWHLGHPEADK